MTQKLVIANSIVLVVAIGLLVATIVLGLPLFRNNAGTIGDTVKEADAYVKDLKGSHAAVGSLFDLKKRADVVIAGATTLNTTLDTQSAQINSVETMYAAAEAKVGPGVTAPCGFKTDGGWVFEDVGGDIHCKGPKGTTVAYFNGSIPQLCVPSYISARCIDVSRNPGILSSVNSSGAVGVN